MWTQKSAQFDQSHAISFSWLIFFSFSLGSFFHSCPRRTAGRWGLYQPPSRRGWRGPDSAASRQRARVRVRGRRKRRRLPQLPGVVRRLQRTDLRLSQRLGPALQQTQGLVWKRGEWLVLQSVSVSVWGSPSVLFKARKVTNPSRAAVSVLPSVCTCAHFICNEMMCEQ